MGVTYTRHSQEATCHRARIQACPVRYVTQHGVTEAPQGVRQLSLVVNIRVMSTPWEQGRDGHFPATSLYRQAQVKDRHFPKPTGAG
ncbi:hypothetical protein BaRGS_00000219 [Batillaria attramentaria]|uniref:Uncharacterized protein n=1 Tax=Batillaria attramentaria TaxID=370345 RepID=A0ABD0MCY8_9CAEN